MPPTHALNRFNKLIDDIFRLYVKARNAQVQFEEGIYRGIVVQNSEKFSFL
ncbi:MAG TPA: hypothetical protein VJA17_03740 [Candidatus Omnitrophota bacterium]|nr:hypothetical protein [Candidatus Omnitrophota bacterium]